MALYLPDAAQARLAAPAAGRAPPAPAGQVRAALLRRDNMRHRRTIQAAYLAGIRNAKHEIVLANAYFLPGLTLRRSLLAAAARGVRVIILVQGRIDQALLHYATRVLYRPLLEAGAEIHEYTAGFMHAKVAVVDRRWLTVGSSNIDPLSLLAAREANIVALDAPLAEQLRADIQRHIEEDAQQVFAHHLSKAPWWRRSLPWLAYQMVRGLLGLTGYGAREYRE
ncbi:phospholipase D-like domain-containing protein [Chitinimonas arctica]|uniref:phospholipase D-like domain-containing protein n=1 Tax=Chitinimonas arctica TaxID=2594795 RepID=UPI001CC5A0DB|nr:phospholipase D-like domain-containing protein [Chitinimonas arctica]